MGWLWGSSNDNEKAKDPYSQLDPTLKAFLDQESPLNQGEPQPKDKPRQAANPNYHEMTPNAYHSQAGQPSHERATTSEATTPSVPAESLFPDGRYAHLWKNYRPHHEIEAAAKTDSDRMQDVIDAYNDRRAAIGRAAVENCVFEHMAERDCWENGTMAERLSMCRGRNREFLRCYTMQSRFLKALGYLSFMRSEEEEERIQMHADRLYQEMRDREERAEKARKEGREVETLPPLLSPEATTAALGEDSAYARLLARAKEMGIEGTKLSEYTPEQREQIKKQLQGLNPEQKELELQLIAAEGRSSLDMVDKLRERWAEERLHRAERRERGRETIGDTIKRLWGWDKEP